MPTPCLTTAPTADNPLVVTANAGKINLKLTGTVMFDPSQTDVITTSGQKVAFVCTATTLSFTGVSGTSYYLEVLHLGTLVTSSGNLVEDCDAATVLATLSAGNTYARFQIDVA